MKLLIIILLIINVAMAFNGSHELVNLVNAFAAGVCFAWILAELYS